MKKNIRKVPESVLRKLEKIGDVDVVAGCARKFTAESLRNGCLEHLEVSLGDDGLSLPESMLPEPKQGKFSRRNAEGWVERRDDLPKETHYNSIESPNWGDSYNGTHTVDLPYQAYPRDYHPARELEILLHCPDPAPGKGEYVISARVEEVLNQSEPNFESQLFEDLNLLHENIGGCGVEPADNSISDYARTLVLDWEFLPPGTREEALRRIFRDRHPTRAERDAASERYDFFDSLDPEQFLVGSSGFRRYFGAKIQDDLVVFENMQYGNAIYVMYEDWQELSRRSRVDLLAGRMGDSFDRVVHSAGWQEEVRRLVAARKRS